MRNIFKLLAIACCSFDLNAALVVKTADGNGAVGFNANSGDPIILEITNRGTQKEKVNIDIFGICANGDRLSVESSFNIIGNNIHVRPNETETIKLVPFMDDCDFTKFETVVADSKGNKTSVIMEAEKNQKKDVKFYKITHDENGILKAVTNSAGN